MSSFATRLVAIADTVWYRHNSSTKGLTVDEGSAWSSASCCGCSSSVTNPYTADKLASITEKKADSRWWKDE